MTNSNTPQENPFNGFMKVLLIVTTVSFFIALFSMFSSCASKAPTNTHTIERIVEHKTDSVKFLQVNQGIMDSLFLKIAKVRTAKPECDSITQVAVNQILRQLNSRKKSGDNEMGIYFDELKNQIIAWQKIVQTQNEKTSVNKQATTVNAEREIVQVPVKFIPFWAKALAVVGGITIVYLGYRISRVWVG